MRSSPGSSIGLLTGGSAARLGDLRFRWAPLIALGMAGQVLLFSSPLGDAIGPAAPVVYVASNVAVLVAVWRNLAIPGLPLVLIGGAANLVAIVANRGYMPVSPRRSSRSVGRRTTATRTAASSTTSSSAR